MVFARYVAQDAPGEPGRGSILDGEVDLLIRVDSGGVTCCEFDVARSREHIEDKTVLADGRRVAM